MLYLIHDTGIVSYRDTGHRLRNSYGIGSAVVVGLPRMTEDDLRSSRAACGRRTG